MIDALLRRIRLVTRFRSALSRAYDDAPMHGRLLVWRRLATTYDLEFEPGQPLGNSVLRGGFLGVPVEIALYADEIRVHTVVRMTLSAPLAPSLVSRVNEDANLGARARALLDEPAVVAALGADRARALRETLETHMATVSVSDRTLACSARYVVTVAEHTKLLTVLYSLAQALRPLAAAPS